MKFPEENRCILTTDSAKFQAWQMLWQITRFYAERICFGEPWYTSKEDLVLTQEELDTFYELVNVVCDKETNVEKLQNNVKLQNNHHMKTLIEKLKT
jgi:hypothetical protein